MGVDLSKSFFRPGLLDRRPECTKNVITDEHIGPLFETIKVDHDLRDLIVRDRCTEIASRYDKDPGVEGTGAKLVQALSADQTGRAQNDRGAGFS
jgi:hypothetical protein